MTNLRFDYIKIVVDHAYNQQNQAKLGVNQEQFVVCAEVA